MNRPVKSTMKRFGKDESGAVALIFGLALLPLMGMTGAAVDYSRASQLRTKMAAASDAAVLAGVKTKGTLGDKQKAADAAFAANLGSDPALKGAVGGLTALPGNAYRYEVTADYTYAILGIMPGMPGSTKLAVFSEANAGDGSVEVALVLDNTGSMKSDMSALRKAGESFTNILFDYASNGADLKMSVVPYVAAVNPGRLNLGMSSVDTRGDSQWQAHNLRGRWIGFLPDCTNDPFWKPGPGGGGGGGGGPGPGVGGEGAWLQDATRKLGEIGRELFGIKSASAQVGTYGTPNRKAPFAGKEITVNKPYTKTDGVKAFVPTGFGYDPVWSRCVISNPGKIANLDLFDGIRTKSGTAQWKGCVEARPEPFDVTDDPPNASDPRTLFTPYFWPDEPGKGKDGNSLGYVNNYMDDGDMPAGWNNGWEWEWQANLFKYDGQNKNANFSENAPNTSGPNMACPDELLRLSDDRTKVLNKIKGLKHWNGGGTVSSEGIMWGWRTLSPKLPLADAKPYGTKNHKKIMVVMTDGENLIGGNNVGGPVMSHYNAYGYMRWGRFPQENFQEAAKYLDNRMALACENAKKAGVQVITILFRVNTANAKSLLEKCASNNKLFYLAKDTNELQKAFTDVAELIGKIRLTR
ncbi:MAG: pilus assembly protein TadG-related protein [Beijerinckiaceae bacterium]|nr:pilus assembly protein TadG-related protein [Beijerinckiaceae bacterium]